jgi:hypothetical protein
VFIAVYFVIDTVRQILDTRSYVQGKEYQLLRSGGQTKQLEVPVTMLPNLKKAKLLFVTLDSKLCKRRCD